MDFKAVSKPKTTKLKIWCYLKYFWKTLVFQNKFYGMWILAQLQKEASLYYYKAKKKKGICIFVSEKFMIKPVQSFVKISENFFTNVTITSHVYLHVIILLIEIYYARNNGSRIIHHIHNNHLWDESHQSA